MVSNYNLLFYLNYRVGSKTRGLMLFAWAKMTWRFCNLPACAIFKENCSSFGRCHRRNVTLIKMLFNAKPFWIYSEMKTTTIYIFLLISFLQSSIAQDTFSYDSLIRKLAIDFETPGTAVAIMDNYKFDEFTYGVSNIDTQQPITNKTLFNVASISKLVTAYAIMQLCNAWPRTRQKLTKK